MFRFGRDRTKEKREEEQRQGKPGGKPILDYHRDREDDGEGGFLSWPANRRAIKQMLVEAVPQVIVYGLLSVAFMVIVMKGC